MLAERLEEVEDAQSAMQAKFEEASTRSGATMHHGPPSNQQAVPGMIATSDQPSGLGSYDTSLQVQHQLQEYKLKTEKLEAENRRLKTLNQQEGSGTGTTNANTNATKECPQGGNERKNKLRMKWCNPDTLKARDKPG